MFTRRLLFLLALTPILTAGTHDIILKFSNRHDFEKMLGSWQVLSYDKLSDQNTFRCTIHSELEDDNLMEGIDTTPGLMGCEGNRGFALKGKEPAAFIDQRAIMVLDGSGPGHLTGDFDTLYNQDFLHQIRADKARGIVDGYGVTVAILDTGIDADHPFLAPNIAPNGYDFVDEDGDPMEERSDLDSNGNGYYDEGWGHGTHVAGIVTMIAPGVTILPIRVVNSDGEARLYDIIQGIAYAIDQGADIINLSLSLPESSYFLKEWIFRAFFAGVLVVTSAGNENSGDLLFPANEPLVLAVSSVDDRDIKSGFANYSRQVDICAPGENVLSCLPGGGYVVRSGTSMAAPMAVGQVALLMERFYYGPSLTQIGKVIFTAKNLNRLNPKYQKKLGWGRINVARSLGL